MRGSTLIPWLFFGPLLGAIAAGLAAQFTGWVWATWLAQALTIVLIVVLIAAFVPNYLWYHRHRTNRSNSPDDPTHP